MKWNIAQSSTILRQYYNIALNNNIDVQVSSPVK